MSRLINNMRIKVIDHFRKTEGYNLYEDFLKTQWLSPEEIQQLQMNRMKCLLNHAYTHVPYYNKLLDSHGIHPDDIKDLNDYSKIPILTKELIRSNHSELMAKNKEIFGPRLKASGGSTGKPIYFYLDRKSHSAQWAYLWRSWSMGGWEPVDKMVMIGGTSLYPSVRAFKKWAYTKINNWLLLSAFGMNDDTMEEWIQEIRKFKAKHMYSYASSAYLLAKYVEKNQIKDISFDAVYTTAEVLQPKFRETIERVFSTEVFNIYGGCDGAGFAFECHEHSGLHIVAENCIMEISKDDKSQSHENEDTGELIVTDLFNYAMPFIRYQVGDVGTLDPTPCKCGRGLPLLKNICGRSPDYIVTGEGKRFHEEFFSYLFSPLKWVSQYYVVQNTKSSVHIYLKSDENPSAEDLNKVKSFLEKSLVGLKIQLDLTDDIPMRSSGKFHYIVNNTEVNEDN